MTITKKLIPAATLAAVALGGITGSASAAKPFTPEAAMKAGIKQYAKVGIDGKTAKASKISVDCGPRGKVGHVAKCSGSFRLTLDGKSVDYTLTKKAGVFNNTPHSMEYRVNAKAPKGAGDLPKQIGTFAGFFQDGSGEA